MDLRTLKISQAVKETGMPKAAIRRLLESGAVKGNRDGRVWRISAASLEAWINRTQVQDTPERVSAFAHVEDRFA